MNKEILALLLLVGSYIFINKKSSSSSSTKDDYAIPEDEEEDYIPETTSYNQPQENNDNVPDAARDLTASGFFRIGWLVGKKVFAGRLNVIVKNNSNKISYAVEKVAVKSIKIQNHTVHFDSEDQTQDTYVPLSPGSEEYHTLPMTKYNFDESAYLAQLRQAFYDQCHVSLITSITKVDLNKIICYMDVDLTCRSLDSYNTTERVSFKNVPVKLRYIDETYH